MYSKEDACIIQFIL